MTTAANSEAMAAVAEITACSLALQFLRGESDVWRTLDETVRRLLATRLRSEACKREVAVLRYSGTVQSSRAVLANAATTMGAGLELMGAGAGSGAVKGMTVGSKAAFHTESEFRTSVIRALYAASEHLGIDGEARSA